jgi:prepilin-type N-terminal cleavage/methylation domain-containing protein
MDSSTINPERTVVHIHKKTLRKSGFTIVELLMVVAIIAFIVGVIGFGFIGVVCMGNQYFTPDGVLKKVQLTNTDAVALVDTERNIFRKSVITVKMRSGLTARYRVDSNVLFNYAVTPIPSP